MANTANLGLPIMEAAQSQKHVTHNEDIVVLDGVVQLSVKDRNLTAPPGGAVDGDRYMVASGGTGAWAGKDLNIAYRIDGTWRFLVPKLGWLCWIEDEAKLLVWRDTPLFWQDFTAAGGYGTLGSTNVWTGANSFIDGNLSIIGSSDATKIARFEVDGLTTATTRTYTLPDVTGTIALLSGTQTFSGTTTFTAATVTVSNSTGASTVGLGSGATAAATAKTVNVGTGGVSTSTTTVNIGSATAGALGTTNMNSPTVTFGSTNTAINISGATIFSGPSTDTRLLYVGVGGATADATNRLSVNSPQALFNNVGTSVALTLNKNAAANDASFTLQTGFSARALYGLLGDDHFTIKTTPNGSTYKTGLIVSKDTAAVSLVEHPKFSVYCNFGQNYAAGSWLDMLANIARHNDQGDVVIASNVATFTAPHDGYYMFGAGYTFETPGTIPVNMFVGLSVNGAAPTGDTIGTCSDATITSLRSNVEVTRLLKLTAGQTVKAQLQFITNGGRVYADRNFFWGCQVA